MNRDDASTSASTQEKGTRFTFSCFFRTYPVHVFASYVVWTSLEWACTLCSTHQVFPVRTCAEVICPLTVLLPRTRALWTCKTSAVKLKWCMVPLVRSENRTQTGKERVSGKKLRFTLEDRNNIQASPPQAEDKCKFPALNCTWDTCELLANQNTQIRVRSFGRIYIPNRRCRMQQRVESQGWEFRSLPETLRDAYPYCIPYFTLRKTASSLFPWWWWRWWWLGGGGGTPIWKGRGCSSYRLGVKISSSGTA